MRSPARLMVPVTAKSALSVSRIAVKSGAAPRKAEAEYWPITDELAEAHQAVGDVAGDAVAEILLLGIATQVFERQNHDHRLAVELHGNRRRDGSALLQPAGARHSGNRAHAP